MLLLRYWRLFLTRRSDFLQHIQENYYNVISLPKLVRFSPDDEQTASISQSHGANCRKKASPMKAIET
jgi:hypothetical protein